MKAVTEALGYHREKQHKRSIIVSDSIGTFQNMQKENLYMAWVSIISGSCLRRLILVFYLRHAADNLTEKAIIDDNHNLDSATVIQCVTVTRNLVNFRLESTSYTLSF